MPLRRALQVVLIIAICGVAFSGYLSYRELFAAQAGCTELGAPGSIFGYPPCVYGLVMYAVLVAVAVSGLLYPRHPGSIA